MRQPHDFGGLKVVDAFARRANLVITNISGPRNPLQVGSEEIDRLMLLVPSTGPVGLGVRIGSYSDRVSFGVIADRAVAPDAVELTGALEHELRDHVSAR